MKPAGKTTGRHKPDNAPIPLSGRVYTDRLLAQEHPGLALPDVARAGDLKLIAVPKDGHPHYVKGCCQSFSGFFAAYIHDGKRWRKFALRDGAAVEATYDDAGSRRSKLHACVKALKELAGRNAVWGKSTYTVPYQPKPAPAAKPAAMPAASNGTGEKKAASRSEQLTLF